MEALYPGMFLASAVGIGLVQWPSVYGVGYNGVIDFGFHSIIWKSEGMSKRPALRRKLDIATSVMMQDKI